MEMSNWLSDMGMEDSDFIYQYQMDTFGDLTPEQLAAAFGEDYQHYSSDSTPSPLEVEAVQTCFERSTKQVKTTDNESICTTENSEENRTSQGTQLNQNYAPKSGRGKKRALAPNAKPESNTTDHIIAERKRREKLSQQFIALTTIVPGLKKMDKSSVLGDSIKYLKELQERVKSLEEENAKKKMESVVFIKKIQIPSDDDASSTNENSINSSLPEIEARVSDETVLIRIHCEKRKGVLLKILAAIEDLSLSVLKISVIPFGSSALDMTVVAQMEEEFSTDVQDLVKKLRCSYCRFM